MKLNETIQVLKTSLNKNRLVLTKLEQYYREFLQNEMNTKSPKRADAIVIADILVNYYTCLETMFHRISQFFENSLHREKWHQDLLEKMTLQIDGIREAVISDQTYRILLELLKFRHFKRYYFELDYDWDKLKFLQKKFDQVQILIQKDLDRFMSFLDELADG